MRARYAQFLIVLTLVCAIGGQWVFLQSVAWAGMLVKNSQKCSWSAAIEKTFDGNHPCKLCKMIQEGKKAEKKHKTFPAKTKLDFWLTTASLILDAPRRPVFPVRATEPLPSRCDTPPKPPPRSAA